MHGFKPTGKKAMSGHSFPAHFGFSGSTGQTKSVKPYTRSVPKAKFAEGGSVGHAATQRDQPTSELDVEYGGKTPLRPGFKKGGRPIKRALGGPIKAAKGGALSKVENEVTSSLSKPLAAPKPMPTGLKKFGSFNSKPLIGRS